MYEVTIEFFVSRKAKESIVTIYTKQVWYGEKINSVSTFYQTYLSIKVINSAGLIQLALFIQCDSYPDYR